MSSTSKKFIGPIILVVVLFILIKMCFFIVEEGSQAITIRFGKLEQTYVNAGLKFKLPWDEVKYFSKRLLPWDGDAKRIPTDQSEAQFIWVDTTARWKIVDVKRFYEKLGSRLEALKKLDDIIDSGVKTVISSNLLLEAVRSTRTPLTFDIKDFKNLNLLLISLMDPQDPVSEYISDTLTSAERSDIITMQKLLSSSTDASKGGGATSSDITAASSVGSISFEANKVLAKQIQSLIKVFNNLLNDKNFYSDNVFSGIPLISYAKALISKKNKSDEEFRILNRLLIEAAYPQSINISPVKKGRKQLSQEILELVQEKMQEKGEGEDYTTDDEGNTINQFGIEMIDIVIRQIKYSDELTDSVYKRMIKERNQIAEKTRAEGEGEKNNILGKLANEVQRIESDAKRRSEEIKGEADAEATKIYAEAYQQDPSFFKLWRTLESYKEVMPNFNKTLSTDAEYFDFLYNQLGR